MKNPISPKQNFAPKKTKFPPLASRNAAFTIGSNNVVINDDLFVFSFSFHSYVIFIVIKKIQGILILLGN